MNFELGEPCIVGDAPRREPDWRVWYYGLALRIEAMHGLSKQAQVLPALGELIEETRKIVICRQKGLEFETTGVSQKQYVSS